MDVSEFLKVLHEAPARLAQNEYRGALEQAGYLLGEEVRQNFLRQESGDGSPWPPHAPLTVKLHGPHPLLRLTWRMYAAATNMDDPGAKKLLSDRELVVGIDGNEIGYAAVQDRGGRGESGNWIPRREFFFLNEGGQEKMAEQIADDIAVTVQHVFAR